MPTVHTNRFLVKNDERMHKELVKQLKTWFDGELVDRYCIYQNGKMEYSCSTMRVVVNDFSIKFYFEGDFDCVSIPMEGGLMIEDPGRITFPFKDGFVSLIAN